MLLVYYYAVFFSLCNDQKCTIKNQSKSGQINQKVIKAYPTASGHTSEHRRHSEYLCSADLEKEVLEALP